MITTMENIIEYWYNSGFEAYSSYHNGESDWGNKSIAEEYLRKYCLSENEEGRLRVIQESVFCLDRQLPDMIFRKDFEFITLLGGAMFEQKDFDQFKSCLQQIEDRHFLVAQDTFGMPHDQKQYALKMKYPSNIGWDELMSGNFISTILFEPFYNHYYVFGESGKWGMYVANEGYKGDEAVNPAGTPIRIIGFNPKYRTIFRDAFEIPEGEYCENVDYIPEEERPDLKEWVPEKYRK